MAVEFQGKKETSPNASRKGLLAEMQVSVFQPQDATLETLSNLVCAAHNPSIVFNNVTKLGHLALGKLALDLFGQY